MSRDRPAADVFLNLLQAAIVVSAVVVVSTDWKHTTWAMALGCLSLLSGWVPRAQEKHVVFLAGAIGGAGLYGLAVFTIVWYLLREQDVSFDTLCAALCGYLLIGFFWTELNDLIEFYHSCSIVATRGPQCDVAWPELLYFSFATLTTSGNGEFLTATAAARSAALLEAVTGVFYVAVMISRLVGLHIASGQNARGGG